MVEPPPARIPLPELVARPPTPPRESQRGEPKASLITRFFLGEPKARRSSAPTITPNSSAEIPVASPNTSLTSRKKVEWSDSPIYRDPPRLSVDSKGIAAHAVQPLAPSSERKPSKSILKAYNGVQEREYNNAGTKLKLLPPHQHENFATMLESIVQQLAGGDREGKMDAYLMLSGTLKASENVPDLKALRSKMTLLQQFITRDLTERSPAGKVDTPLVINALVLLSGFLHKPAIGDTFTSEFTSFIVDHGTKTFEDVHASKDIVKHLMFVLAQQKFSSHTMNSSRVGKLITALHNIENHVKGKGIVMGRINIYRTLLRQSRPHMLAHIVWIQDLFTDMLSSIKEIRSLAITFGLEASYGLGIESKLSRSVSQLFQMEQDEGRKYADLYVDRLKAFLKNKPDSMFVPQIWSVVILFLRGKSRQIEQWTYLDLFFKVVQECFNSSDTSTKVEANYAWNRLVFSVLPDEKTSTMMIKTLAQPLPQQLKRKSTSTRKVALGSVCNLLYYTLKPSSNSTQLDLFWDQYVNLLVGQCLTPTNIVDNLEVAQRNIMDACQILQSLFDSSSQRPWTEARAMANLQQNSVEAKELPALDPKWLRRSSSRVFSVLTPIIEKLFWELGHESTITNLWQTYITSIASPAVMEVKVSNDAMSAIAAIFGLLHRIWHTGPQSIPALPSTKNHSNGEFLQSFEQMVATTVRGLGILPFTDRLLCIGKQDTFIPVATPSHRPEKLKGEVRSPLQHLFCLLAETCPGLQYDGRFSQMVRSLLSPFFEDRKSSKSRTELAKDLLPFLPPNSTPPCKILWQTLADFAATATDTRESGSGSLEQPLGVDYRSVGKILEAGIAISPQEPPSGWKALFAALVNSVTLDAGDSGRAIVVVEPLAKFLTLYNSKSPENAQCTGLPYCHLLLQTARYPRDRQALDAARKRLWGGTNPGAKAPTFDPYTQCYTFIRVSLQTAYHSFSTRRLHDYTDIVSALTSLVGRCPDPLVVGALARLQDGIAPWMLDEGSKLTGGTALSKEIASLSGKLCALIIHVHGISADIKILSELEIIIVSGLRSSHKSIASRFIQMWNATFGSLEEIPVCPQSIKEALLRLKPIADLRLVSFPDNLESDEDVDQRQPIVFGESQEDSTSYIPSASTESVLRKHHTPVEESSPMRRLRQTTPQVIIPSMRKRSREETPDVGKRKSRKRESTPKLRHDDSQIQFQPVESSPILGTAVESQILTNRQKEVKERQQTEAAMFPDLHSSPHPKTREQQSPIEQPNLPLYRSTSKSRTRSPSQAPPAPRQTTPTPLPQSEDDNYIVSSPTPKRGNGQQAGLLDPPSSPPEAAPKVSLIIDGGLRFGETSDIPSSPPETADLLDNNPIHSVEYPSAQVDPFAMQNNLTVSTYVSTAEGSSALHQPNAPTKAIKEEKDISSHSEDIVNLSDVEEQDADNDDQEMEGIAAPDPPGTNVGRNERLPPPIQERQGSPIPVSEDTPMLESTIDTPATPNRSRSKNTEVLSSPPYEDAKSSPASSDRNTNDHFEDAVTSPQRLSSDRRMSASFGEFDDSSMLRIMDQIEQPTVSAETLAKTTPPIRTSPKKGTLHTPAAANSPSRGSMRIAALRNATTIETRRGKDHGPTAGLPIPDAPPDSPTASLIPETPAAKILNLKEKIMVDGEELDPQDTIVVDTAAWADEERAIALRMGRKRKSTGSKKRKIGETGESEVPNSQERLSETPSAERRSPRKKLHGRLKQSSQLSQEIDGTSDLERSQEIASVDLDASQDISFAESVTELPSPAPRNFINVEDRPEYSPIDDTSMNVEPQVPATSGEIPTAEVEAKEPVSTGEATCPDVEMLMETVIDDTKLSEDHFDDSANGLINEEDAVLAAALDNIVPQDLAPRRFLDELQEQLQAEQQFEVESEIAPVDNSKESGAGLQTSAPLEVERSDAAVQTSQVEEVVRDEIPTYGSVQAKVQSLVRDLALVAFTREQVGSLEDMFMDVKEKLYGAGRRGRQSDS
ncbi:Rap1-interacting factor 1 N terminal-domain-containing protein [Halenospora varia]|nr:Rap1-interacting factor 1 N terminal-domain-containing protein [Halenospora varia]